MNKIYKITEFTSNSRPDNYVLCFENKWHNGVFKTWKDFLTDTAKLRSFIESKNSTNWIVHCEDYWNFLVTFIALLQCKKRIYLTQNIAESFIEEIKKENDAFITDRNVDGAVYVPLVLENCKNPSEEEIRTTPKISAEETEIYLYTSGSTGKSKAVLQRMKEFEEDNAFVMSKWGEEFSKRKLITTVSQHHIYGFLFGICIPFSLGIPFRRKRIEFPEEFESLDDTPYVLIATPAFLKRTTEGLRNNGILKLPMESPFIFTSGGAVSPELAVDTAKCFGVYPLEVYGSTETSGIAYRQQNINNLEWTPFDNAKIWKGDDGCLRIISPYIRNPEGFATADLVDFIEGTNRFILKGRADSIVKIEQKRISLTEMENRLLESGLVADVKVVALSNDVRQFLGAALVFSKKGKEFFEGMEKFSINRYLQQYLQKYFENVVIPKKWRYLDALPTDVQGKKHKDEIVALFEK
ncbi:MAG: AMP-binding protein [Treponema sp.]|nr:AMP-binding protein [Treponema sp.]